MVVYDSRLQRMILVPACAIVDCDAPFDWDFKEHSEAKPKEFQSDYFKTQSAFKTIVSLCQVRQKQLSVDQLQYELTTQNRRAADELTALKQRLTELQLQLAQTRKEADEYFKSGLERNAEATSLENQVNCQTPVVNREEILISNQTDQWKAQHRIRESTCTNRLTV